MRIHVFDPNRVYDWIDHLCNGPFTYDFIFDVFFLAVLKTDIGKQNIEGSFGHGFFGLIDDEMAGFANRG